MLSRKRLWFGSVLCFLIALAIACGSSTKLVTINIDQDRLNRILFNITVNDPIGDFVFRELKSTIEQNRVIVDGLVESKSGEVTGGKIELSVSADEGSFEFLFIGSDVEEIQSSERFQRELSKQLTNLVIQYVTDGRSAVEIIAVDIIDDVIRLSYRY